MFERLATPRPAPKITLKSRWQAQQQHSQQPQQQPQLPESASTGVWQQAMSIFEQSESGDKGSTAETQCPTSTWQQVRGTAVPVEKPNVDIDLRTNGITQEAILNDNEHWKEIHDKSEEVKSLIAHKVYLRRPEKGQHA